MFFLFFFHVSSHLSPFPVSSFSLFPPTLMKKGLHVVIEVEQVFVVVEKSRSRNGGGAKEGIEGGTEGVSARKSQVKLFYWFFLLHVYGNYQFQTHQVTSSRRKRKKVKKKEGIGANLLNHVTDTSSGKGWTLAHIEIKKGEKKTE